MVFSEYQTLGFVKSSIFTLDLALLNGSKDQAVNLHTLFFSPSSSTRRTKWWLKGQLAFKERPGWSLMAPPGTWACPGCRSRRQWWAAVSRGPYHRTKQKFLITCSETCFGLNPGDKEMKDAIPALLSLAVWGGGGRHMTPMNYRTKQMVENSKPNFD